MNTTLKRVTLGILLAVILILLWQALGVSSFFSGSARAPSLAHADQAITPTFSSTSLPTGLTPTPENGDVGIQQVTPEPTTASDTHEVEIILFNCPDGTIIETLQVKLIHKGSGFIKEGAIGTAGSTVWDVPYDGNWEVFVGERLIGTVASNGVLQSLSDIPCPLPTLIPTPEFVPETGGTQSAGNPTTSLILSLVAFLGFLGIAGFVLYKILN